MCDSFLDLFPDEQYDFKTQTLIEDAVVDQKKYMNDGIQESIIFWSIFMT